VYIRVRGEKVEPVEILQREVDVVEHDSVAVDVDEPIEGSCPNCQFAVLPEYAAVKRTADVVTPLERGEVAPDRKIVLLSKRGEPADVIGVGDQAQGNGRVVDAKAVQKRDRHLEYAIVGQEVYA